MKNAYLELLLRLRRTQPAEWGALDPSVRLQALEYEASQRERLEVEHEDETEAA
jgi:hypothetical protein